MVTGKWFKDSCPYCKDQGFPSVVGDVETGESVFGFTHLQVNSGADTITFATETGGKVHNMADTDYKVLVTRTDAGSEATSNALTIVSAQTRVSFALTGVTAQYYDVIIRGRILY